MGEMDKHFEPAAAARSGDLSAETVAICSAAISLKRIADALDEFRTTDSENLAAFLVDTIQRIQKVIP